MFGQKMIARQKLYNDIMAVFAQTDVPNLSEILIRGMYVRADSEPIEILEKLYPFPAVTIQNQYWYCELLPFFSTIGYTYFLPKLFAFFLEYPDYLSSNIYSSFEYCMMANVEDKLILKEWSQGLTSVQAAAVYSLFDLIEGDLKVYNESLKEIHSWKSLIKGHAIESE